MKIVFTSKTQTLLIFIQSIILKEKCILGIGKSLIKMMMVLNMDLDTMKTLKDTFMKDNFLLIKSKERES